MTYRLAALCAGYGGLEMGVALAGVDFELVWYAELDPHASKVLAHHHPHVPNLGDLTKITPDTLIDMDLTKHQETAERRYALYQSGLSLDEVAKLEGVTRQTVFKQFDRRGWKLRQRPAHLSHVEFNGHKYTMRNNGYLGRTTGDRTLLHRDIWESVNGPIPANHDIHHIDHDRLNNEPSNLELISKSEHARQHALAARLAGEPTEPSVDIVTAGFP